MGPVGKKPGEGTVPLDLSVKALRQLEIALIGEMVDPATGSVLGKTKAIGIAEADLVSRLKTSVLDLLDTKEG